MADDLYISVEATMSEVEGRLALMEANLPKRIDAMAVSQMSKLPFKALWYREALIWRMAELGRQAFQSFTNKKLASAILLTRAAVETSAGLWYLCTKVEASLLANSVRDVDNYLMKMLMGTKTELDIMPPAINVLTFIDRVEKDIPGFRQQYDRLSEFAHPNWAGTVLLYSKPDQRNLATEFGANLRSADDVKAMGLHNLAVALQMFELAYNKTGDLIPAFSILCEDNLKTGAS